MPSQLRASQSLGNPLGSPWAALGQLLASSSGPALGQLGSGSGPTRRRTAQACLLGAVWPCPRRQSKTAPRRWRRAGLVCRPAV